MKALILSLVIAFSSSFALACTKSDGNLGWNGHDGKYTRANKVQPRTSAPALSVAAVPTNGAPR